MIPVEVPEIQAVHTADLFLPNTVANHIHATVGEAIPARLTLWHTRRWCCIESREADLSLEFSYEILSNPEIWLVGGRRRGNFTAKEGEIRSFTIMLLPQRTGHLLLPGLDVKTFVSSQPSSSVSNSDPLSPPQRRQIPCELDYRNHGQTVLVSPDLRKTTISLDATGNTGPGSWLVDSERRVGVAS